MEIAALDVIEMAVIDVVDGVAEDVEFLGFGEDGSVDVAEGGGGDDEEFVMEIGRLEWFGEPVDLAIADELREITVEFGSDDGDAGSGFEE